MLSAAGTWRARWSCCWTRRADWPPPCPTSSARSWTSPGGSCSRPADLSPPRSRSTSRHQSKCSEVYCLSMHSFCKHFSMLLGVHWPMAIMDISILAEAEFSSQYNSNSCLIPGRPPCCWPPPRWSTGRTRSSRRWSPSLQTGYHSDQPLVYTAPDYSTDRLSDSAVMELNLGSEKNSYLQTITITKWNKYFRAYPTFVFVQWH